MDQFLRSCARSDIAKNLIIASAISANFICHIKLAENPAKKQQRLRSQIRIEAVCYIIPTEVTPMIMHG